MYQCNYITDIAEAEEQDTVEDRVKEGTETPLNLSENLDLLQDVIGIKPNFLILYIDCVKFYLGVIHPLLFSYLAFKTITRVIAISTKAQMIGYRL